VNRSHRTTLLPRFYCEPKPLCQRWLTRATVALRGIPIRQQIILYNQQLLYDDLNVQGCFIHNGSRIIVQIHADAPSPAASSEHDSDFSTGRDLNLPPTPSSERHSEFPPPQPQVRDLNLLPSPPLLCDLNLMPSPAPPHDLIMPVLPPVRDLSFPPLRAPVLDLNLLLAVRLANWHPILSLWYHTSLLVTFATCSLHRSGSTPTAALASLCASKKSLVEVQLWEEREEGVADSRRGEVEGFAKLKP